MSDPEFSESEVRTVALAIIAGLFGGTALIGAGTGATGPALSAILGDITPGSEIGRMAGVNNFMGDIGSTLGPLLSVPMVDVWFGFEATYWGCVVLVAATAVVVAVPLLTWETGPRTVRS